MSSEAHVGDIGTQLIMTVKEEGVAVDISTATQLILYMRKPNGVTYTLTPSFYTDGTDGIIKYLTVDGDLNAPGTYKLQAKIVIGGSTYSSSVLSFIVHCNI